MFRSGRTRPAHAQSGGSEGLLRIRSLAASNLDFGSEQVTGYPEARSSGLRRAGQRDTKHRRGTIRPIHGFWRVSGIAGITRTRRSPASWAHFST